MSDRGCRLLTTVIVAVVALFIGLTTSSAQSEFEVLQGMDMPGGDYLTIEGGKHGQCTAQCAADGACQGYTYNVAKRVCFLKDRVGRAKRFKGAISGRKNVGQTRSEPSVASSEQGPFEIFDDADMPGGDFDVLRGTSLDQCQQICAGMPECQAFTQNIAKSVCFLKSGTGEPQRFAGAVSGRKVAEDAVVASAAPEGSLSQGFVVYKDTDLPGGDGSIIDQQAGSLENCQLQCLFNDQCDAFTYNHAANLCSGKSRKHIGGDRMSPVMFAGATSGMKASPNAVAAARQNFYETGPKVPEADLAWRKDDTAETFVARIRTAAKSMGGSCEVERAQMQEIAASVRAEFSTPSVTAGNSVKAKWAARPQEKAPPLWLMISADGPVRFSAPGFYALTPQAIGPFGLATDADRTRAMTTLFGKAAHDKSDVEIVALRAGALNLTVRAVGYLRACEEEFSQDIAATTVTVSRSPVPTFQVRDPFSFDVPKKAWLSPDGTTKLEVFEGRFRIVEIASGAFIVDREGRDPYYSPTGRFVSYSVGEFGQEVIDTVDGAIVGNTQGVLAWENSDSFLVDGVMNGNVNAASVLVADAQVGTFNRCRAACPGRNETYVLDLENDMIRVSSTSDRLSGKQDSDSTSGESKASAIRFAADQTGAAPVYFPERWDLRGGLFFVPAEQWVDTANGGQLSPTQVEEKENMFYAKEAGHKDSVETAGLQAIGIGQWRGAVRLERPRAERENVRLRLSELGLRFSDERAPSFTLGSPLADFGREGIEDLKPDLAKRILAAVPSAKGAFTREQETYPCNPPDTAPNGLEAVRPIFDRAMEFKLAERSIWLTMYVCVEGAAAFYYPNLHFFDSTYDAGFLRVDGVNPDEDVGSACAQDISHCNFDAKLYADRYLLIWSTQSRGIMLFDIDARKTIYKQFNLGRGELLKEAFYSVEDQHITQVNTDGSFFVYDVPGNKRVLEGRYVDDETIAWTPDLRFDASPEGANYVSLRFPGQPGQYSFQQFAKAVKRPGLVSEVLDRRYQPANLTLNLPPTLSGEIAAQGGRVVGLVRVAGAVEVRVYQDGLLSDTIRTQPGQESLPVDTGLMSGARWISLVAVDAEGLASLPVGRDVAGRDHSLPTVHALAVGVDRYATLPALTYAARDAVTLKDALTI